MNINCGNQFNINDPSHFIQNQQLGSNISQSNMMLFQQQLKMGMLNNQNHQNDIQSLLNPSINLSQINNQALLLYDKHTNSIIPINSGFGQNIGNTQFNGSAVFTPMHLSGISTIENPSAVKPKNGLQKQFDLDTSKPEGVKCSIPHYFKGGNITLNQTNLQEKPTNSKIIRQISKEDKSIPLSLDAELSENQTACFNKQSSEESKSDLEILTKSGSLGIISKCTIEKGPAVDSLNNRLQTGIRAIEISKLKASDFELNNRESEQFTIEAKHIPKTTCNELQRNVENNKPDSQLSNQSNEKDENNEIEEDNKTKDNLIWISFDDNGTQQCSNKKKIIEKRMNCRNKQAKTKESNHKSNISALTSNSKSRKDIQNYNNFDDVNNTTKASAGTKNNIQESESKTSSVAQTPIHTATKSRGLKAERRNTPIMVDLFDSEANSINSKNNGLLLESGDNPICSFSSKRGVVGLKAFHPGETGKPKPEEIINLPSNEHTANSSLAEMFMSKKQNVMSRIDNREKCKSKNRQNIKPKTKEELYEIRKNMMKRNRSTSPHVNPNNNLQEKESKIKGNEQEVYDIYLNMQDSKAKQAAKCKEPSQDLISRLANGKKQKVNEKEMKRLTSKNYERLPEVQKMKEAQKKKEEIKARMNKAKEYDKKRKCDRQKN